MVHHQRAGFRLQHPLPDINTDRQSNLPEHFYNGDLTFHISLLISLITEATTNKFNSKGPRNIPVSQK